MQFQPKSEREIRESMMLEDGEYDFEVTAANDETSKKGNDMIAMTLKVFGDGGGEVTVRDWLVASTAALSQLKILHFCEATGIMGAYHDGSVDGLACYGLTGRALIGHREQEGYPPQNVIVDYIPRAEKREPLGVPATQTKAANKTQEQKNQEAVIQGFPAEEVPF